MDSPKVTVLMSVYNGEKYLKEAIESILTQTFRDFEFIIIDDGSTDGTSDILARCQQMDDRIRVYPQENRGLVASLNRGCQLAKGEYIARMDADDISLPERFAKQVEFLNAHLEVGVLGTWVEVIDNNGIIRGTWHSPQMPEEPALVAWTLMFHDCLAHPSVMMRRLLVEQLGGYNADSHHFEDYEFWARAISITQLANLPQALVQRRVWDETIGARHLHEQEEGAITTMHSMITRLLKVAVPVYKVASLRKSVLGHKLTSIQEIESVVTLIQQLYRAYLNTYSLNHTEAREVARDAARRLHTLALMTKTFSRWKSFVILFQASTLDRRLLLKLYPMTVLQGIKALAKWAWQR